MTRARSIAQQERLEDQGFESIGELNIELTREWPRIVKTAQKREADRQWNKGINR